MKSDRVTGRAFVTPRHAGRCERCSGSIRAGERMVVSTDGVYAAHAHDPSFDCPAPTGSGTNPTRRSYR
jgi:hypothetical protein